MKQPTKAELKLKIEQLIAHNAYLINHENETLDMYKARLQDIQKLKQRFNNLEQAQTHNWNYYKTNRAKLTEIIKDLNERVIPKHKETISHNLLAWGNLSLESAKRIHALEISKNEYKRILDISVEGIQELEEELKSQQSELWHNWERDVIINNNAWKATIEKKDAEIKALTQELNLYKPDEEEVEYLPEPPASIPDPFGFDNDDLPF